MRTFIYILILSGFFLASCGEYKMHDMATDSTVTVDDLVKSGEYKPEICNASIDKLFKKIPPLINDNNAPLLNQLLDKWATKQEAELAKKGNDVHFPHNDPKIVENSTYMFSYIYDKEPMHVFAVCITRGNEKEMDYTSVFIRIDNKGGVFGEFSEDCWVQNACDKLQKCPDNSVPDEF